MARKVTAAEKPKGDGVKASKSDGIKTSLKLSFHDHSRLHSLVVALNNARTPEGALRHPPPSGELWTANHIVVKALQPVLSGARVPWLNGNLSVLVGSSGSNLAGQGDGSDASAA